MTGCLRLQDCFRLPARFQAGCFARDASYLLRRDWRSLGMRRTLDRFAFAGPTAFYLAPGAAL
jgi:hypothetical protein